ncbi:MAG: ABC transporter ATP-binding protein [Oscillospiraceae bacterium]
MKNKTAEKWIFENSKSQIPMLVLLSISNAVYAVLGVSMALLSKYIIDSAQKGSREDLIKYSAILLLNIVLQVVINIFSKSFEARVKGKLEIKYKSKLFSAILKKDYSVITKYHSGELLNRLTGDVAIVADGVATILPISISMITRLVAAFLILINLDKYFAFVIIAAGIALFVITRLFRGSIKRLHKKVMETDGKTRSFMQEGIESLLVIKIFGVDKKMKENANELQEENYKAKIKKNNLSIFANTGFSMAFSFGQLFALVWCALKLCTGTISFGTLTALIQLVNQVQAPLSGISGIFPSYYAMLSSAERIMEIEDLSESKAINSSDIDIKKLENNFNKISFEGVSFSYENDMLYKDATFEIFKNDFVVISGISGIGKSTLFKLLVGVLPPTKGKIEICSETEAFGTDKYTRPLFAYVPQGNMLFSGTIRENVRFIKSQATDEQILEALKISCAYNFVMELPKGLDTELLENGQGLSEGQIQRLAVARAILCDAPILLLDEATSALDEETEKELLKNIKAINNKTCIIISHKNAAYEICNKEIIIKNDKIILNSLK